jgi:hypothetical protein
MPSRATIDSINKLVRNPRATLSSRDDLRVANFMARNAPPPMPTEDVVLNEYVQMNDGGIAKKTKVY